MRRWRDSGLATAKRIRVRDAYSNTVGNNVLRQSASVLGRRPLIGMSGRFLTLSNRIVPSGFKVTSVCGA
jgi:hypothetical protein